MILGYKITIWSSYGHRFTGTDSEDVESCLTCGAEYRLVPDNGDMETGNYVNASGEDAAECTGDVSMVHGYERHCEHHNGRGCLDVYRDSKCRHERRPGHCRCRHTVRQDAGVCRHVNHDCRCLLCA